MPKLQRRLREQQQQQQQHQLQLDRRKEFGSGAHGSDSGISMASQDVVDIYELLQVIAQYPGPNPTTFKFTTTYIQRQRCS
jgi:hypothetical protein